MENRYTQIQNQEKSNKAIRYVALPFAGLILIFSIIGLFADKTNGDADQIKGSPAYLLREKITSQNPGSVTIKDNNLIFDKNSKSFPLFYIMKMDEKSLDIAAYMDDATSKSQEKMKYFTEKVGEIMSSAGEKNLELTVYGATTENKPGAMFYEPVGDRGFGYCEYDWSSKKATFIPKKYGVYYFGNETNGGGRSLRPLFNIKK